MTDSLEVFGSTIQLFLVDGTPNGLIIASIHGWTGSVPVATQATFGRLLARPEVDRTGVYILFGPDPEDALRSRAYIGEADSVRERIDQNAADRGFWETAVVITTSDEPLTKGHVRYLEARLLEISKDAGRVVTENVQNPDSERRRLPEADRANMEAFLSRLKVMLPVIGLDLLKPKPRIARVESAEQAPPADSPRFEIRHKSGVRAQGFEEDGELKGSSALKDAGYKSQGYAELKRESSKGFWCRLLTARRTHLHNRMPSAVLRQPPLWVSTATRMGVSSGSWKESSRHTTSGKKRKKWSGEARND